jgi:hypothetical protein
MDFLQRFNEEVDKVALRDGTLFTMRMYLINLMCYSSAKKLKDVDFSTFTVSDLKDSFEVIFEYESDEYDDPSYGECRNIGNPIYELNSLAGFIQGVLAIKPQLEKIRRFF